MCGNVYSNTLIESLFMLFLYDTTQLFILPFEEMLATYNMAGPNSEEGMYCIWCNACCRVDLIETGASSPL